MNQASLIKQKQDLEKLIELGDQLHLRLLIDLSTDTDIKKKEEIKKNNLPSFKRMYESWYSEARQVIKLLLPDRLQDFTLLYRNEKRKEIDCLSYTISDYMIGITVNREGKNAVGPETAYVKYNNQLLILKAVRQRFESSLFNIRQVVQADLFENELEEATELVKRGFHRGAGVIAGVVLEKHLAEVSSNHELKTTKRNPTIADFNELLKNNEVIDVVNWRFIQRLGDIRNLCGHNKDREPEKEEVQELIKGVDKIIKTIY